MYMSKLILLKTVMPTCVNKNSAKCDKCQVQLCDNSGKHFTWFINEKHGNVCQSCLEELDKQGELWDNFFEIRSYNYCPGNSDPGMESGLICNCCYKTMIDRQVHKKENGKWVLKHNCQVKCVKKACGKETFQLTQD